MDLSNSLSLTTIPFLIYSLCFLTEVCVSSTVVALDEIYIVFQIHLLTFLEN